MSIIFLFVDGIGIDGASEKNPFSFLDLPGFKELAGGKLLKETSEFALENRLFKAIDANLGVNGLPQSGTGQASLFCGINASKIVGEHFGPYPHSKTKEFLQNHSVFSDLQRMGKTAHFMNAYPEVFFELAKKRKRWTSTTLMTLGAGLKLNTIDEVRAGTAITAEIKQDYWREKLKLDIPDIDEKTAAGRILDKSQQFDFTLYEYYLTDKAGHEQNLEMAKESLSRLDTFIYHILEGMDKSHQTFVLTSDHGNLEDLGVKTHTRNPIPLFVYGEKAMKFADVTSLVDIKKSILNCF